LSDSDVDAEKFLLLISTVVETLLVDDGIDGNGGFAVSVRDNEEISNVAKLLYLYSTIKKIPFSTRNTDSLRY